MEQKSMKRRINIKIEDDDTDPVKPEKRTKLIANKKKTTDIEPLWEDYEIIEHEIKDVNGNTIKTVLELLDSGNTVPFIARYRKHVTGNLQVETIHEIKKSYEEVINLKAKIKSVLTTVEKNQKLNENLRKSILSVRSIDELECIYAPLKPGSKGTLASRAEALGLSEPALKILENKQESIKLERYINSKEKDLANVNDVEKGIIHILAAIIASDSDVLEFTRHLRNSVNFMIEVRKRTETIENKNVKEAKKINKKGAVNETVFENYFDFKIPLKYIKPHQVLAINRGENQEVLNVKVVVPDIVYDRFEHFCKQKWFGNNNVKREQLLIKVFKDSYSRLIKPQIIRKIRADLKENAQKASYAVFTKNLKQLLLATPIKGEMILGMDPGFSNGCKIALINQTGTLLDHHTIFPFKKNGEEAISVLQRVLVRNNCRLIALGNGKGCRETEEWLCNLIQCSIFEPLDVKYTIVNEDGASIYSCSSEAIMEFPNLDPNIISAVSLARRLQDPLSELVKVEPQHLGVGMYQHDMKEKHLENGLKEVVSECVSFVGVDINTASECLLKYISGLSDKKAKLITEYRQKNGSFISRQQLKEIKGIGPKVFEQCAGFLRVGPIDPNNSEQFYANPKTNRLDCTIIHPESYDLASKILKYLNLSITNIGNDRFISLVKANLDKVKQKQFHSEASVNLILDALCKPLNYDFRNEFSQVPLFKKGLAKISEIDIGTTLTGRVLNVTHFGCFVDVGVEFNGLIHSSKLNGLDLNIGDKVEVILETKDISKKRIGLRAIKKQT